ncbi:GntR family transcriptional regulator [Microbacterium sp. KR10-403]|uniref:FadR/GntR family transcriptional regulator n=1 Tax=Microbacterium sp. KR10-403 TaxID=3158581 RepID=UPI0032E3AE52
MPQATVMMDAAHAVVYSALDGTGRAERVTQRLTDAIVSGTLEDGERLPSESDLAARLGVAVVTAREALETLRAQGLLVTRRGRAGGSYVRFDPDAAEAITRSRVDALSRLELRDLAVHYAAIAGMAAEVAADRAGEDDLQTLTDIDARADLSDSGAARRAVGRFQLQVAATSQSLRLVHVELQLQAEVGPVLWLCLREEEYRVRSHRARLRVIDALRDLDPAAARSATTSLIDEAAEWLVAEKTAIERAKGQAS